MWVPPYPARQLLFRSLRWMGWAGWRWCSKLFLALSLSLWVFEILATDVSLSGNGQKTVCVVSKQSWVVGSWRPSDGARFRWAGCRPFIFLEMFFLNGCDALVFLFFIFLSLWTVEYSLSSFRPVKNYSLSSFSGLIVSKPSSMWSLPLNVWSLRKQICSD